LVPINDSVALAAAIGRILREGDFASRLAANGRDAYRSEFTEEAVVRRYLDFFAEVTG
jgi:glycosyltransferase involved in cell wall biosynthesis